MPRAQDGLERLTHEGGGFASVRSSANMSDMDPTNMNQALAGRAVLVTGAARRIGAAMARGFHAHGADICIHCHQSIGEAEQLRDELNSRRARSATIVTADLLDVATLPGIVTAAVSAFGRL